MAVIGLRLGTCLASLFDYAPRSRSLAQYEREWAPVGLKHRVPLSGYDHADTDLAGRDTNRLEDMPRRIIACPAPPCR